MVKARVISLTLLAPLLLAPTSANAGTSPPQSTIAKPATPGASAPGNGSTRKVTRSRERIYTYKPAATEPQPAGSARPVRVNERSPAPFVGFSPVGNSVMGVGLWRMPKVDSLDPNRGQPLRDMKGKTGRAAAVGFQLAF